MHAVIAHARRHRPCFHVRVALQEVDGQATRWVIADPKLRDQFPKDQFTLDQVPAHLNGTAPQPRLPRVCFGPLALTTVWDPAAYLARDYGDAWATVAQRGHNHLNKRATQKGKMQTTGDASQGAWNVGGAAVVQYAAPSAGYDEVVHNRVR
jgi:hypothetical protein